MILLLLMLVLPARADRMLSYREALEAAVTSNPQLARAALTRERAEATMLGARGIFDPSLNTTGSWSLNRDESFFGAAYTTSDSRVWDVQSSLGGQLATGTRYNLTGRLSQTDFLRASADPNDPLASFFDIDSSTRRPRLEGSITQELLKGVRMSYNLQNVTAARDGQSVAALSLERTRQQALADTASAYWTLVYQSQLREIALQSEAVAAEALRVGELKLAAGELAPVERTRLEAALVQAKSAALDADNAARQASDLLMTTIGQNPGLLVIPSTEPGLVRELQLDEAAVVATATAQNLDLAVAHAELDAAEVVAMNARHGLLPSLSATASGGVGKPVTTQKTQDGRDTRTGASRSLSMGATLALPLGNRVARSAARQAAVDVLAKRSDLKALERSVETSVLTQLRTLHASKQRVALADANVRLAAETLRAEEALAAVGRAIQKDVLEARTERDRARSEAAKARTDYRLAQVELLRLQGLLTQEMS